MLRIQIERQSQILYPGIREYVTFFGIDKKMMNAEKKAVLVMHPGAMNRGVEIASDVADGSYSVLLDQVANGVAVCISPLCPLIGGSRGDDVD